MVHQLETSPCNFYESKDNFGAAPTSQYGGKGGGLPSFRAEISTVPILSCSGNKQSFTVVLAVKANDEKLPPKVIFKGICQL